MNTEQKYIYRSKSLNQSLELGAELAKLIEPTLLIELVGDLGSGKTALVKAIARGLGIEQTVTSPTFNIHRRYQAPGGTTLEHFDFYRLEDDEVVVHELQECLAEPNSIVCTEWANRLSSEITDDKLIVKCLFVTEAQREYEFIPTGQKSNKIVKGLIE